jgi:hypothetical protein
VWQGYDLLLLADNRLRRRSGRACSTQALKNQGIEFGRASKFRNLRARQAPLVANK